MTKLRLRYTWLLLGAYLAWAVCYELVGHVAARLPTHDLTTAWDRAIPLLPQAVWIYEACYLFPFMPILVARDWRRIDVWLLACLLASLSAFVVYLALPVAFPRPALGQSLAERVIALEHALDFEPGANNLPSLHVALSWLTAHACAGHRRSVWFARGAFLLAALITISTLLVKQHLLWDVASGMLWAPVSWRAARVLQSRCTRQQHCPVDGS